VPGRTVLVPVARLIVALAGIRVLAVTLARVGLLAVPAWLLVPVGLPRAVAVRVVCTVPVRGSSGGHVVSVPFEPPRNGSADSSSNLVPGEANRAAQPAVGRQPVREETREPR